MTRRGPVSGAGRAEEKRGRERLDEKPARGRCGNWKCASRWRVEACAVRV